MSAALASPPVLAEALEVRRCRLGGLVREAVGSSLAETRRKSLHVAIDVPPALEVDVHPELFAWALARLVQHAVANSPQGDEIVVTAVDTGNAVEIEVADGGPGLLDGPKSSLAALAATREDGSLASLTWVDQIARRHGGRSFVMNCANGGAAYTLRIAKRTSNSGFAKAA